MKGTAYAILIALLVLSFLQPVVEFANILREKVTFNAALYDAYRAAYNNSLTYGAMRDEEAFLDPERFADEFKQALSDTLAMHDTLDSFSHLYGGEEKAHVDFLRNESESKRFNDVSVDITFTVEEGDKAGGGSDNYSRPTMLVHIDASTEYNFVTPLLRAADHTFRSRYALKVVNDYIVQIIN